MDFSPVDERKGVKGKVPLTKGGFSENVNF